MRAWSSIMVMYFHIVWLLPFLLPIPILYSGYSGVYFFFMISGYILMRKFQSEDYKVKGKFNLVKYYVRRMFRIWPLYFLAIPVFASLPLIVAPLSWQDFLFIQNYSPSTFTLSPLWTILIEEVFYLILPIWAIAFTGRWLLSLVSMVCFSIIYMLLVAMMAHSSVQSIMADLQFPAFAMTYALGTIVAQGKTLKVAVPTIFLLWLFASVLLVHVTPGQYAALLPQGIVFSIVYFLVLCNMRNSRIFTNRYSLFLGNITYPMYLLGLPVELTLANFFGVSNLIWVPLTVVMIIVCAYILHKVVERPFIGLGRRLEKAILGVDAKKA